MWYIVGRGSFVKFWWVLANGHHVHGEIGYIGLFDNSDTKRTAEASKEIFNDYPQKL